MNEKMANDSTSESFAIRTFSKNERKENPTLLRDSTW